MKLTFVVHQFLPRYFTGTEQYVYAISKAMQARGHDVEVFALEPNFADLDPEMLVEREVVDGIPVVRIRFWYCADRDFERMEYENPLVSAKFAQHLRDRRPDVVHFFHVRYLGASFLAEAKAQGLPSVAHLMDFWFLCPAIVLRRGDGSLCEGPPDGGAGCIDCFRPDVGHELDHRGVRAEFSEFTKHCPTGTAPRYGPVHRGLTLASRPQRMREMFECVDRVVAPSQFLRAMFGKNGYPMDRIEVKTYGVDESRLTGVTQHRAPANASSPLRVGYFGTIAEYKGVDLAVDAVLGSKASIELTIRGRTTDFADYAQPLVARSATDPRVRFAGPFPREQLGTVLAETDVLVVTSRWYENTPFVVLEAFAAGVPVVAADLGGMSELVRDGENGELFRADDAADLRAKLERLAAEPERLDRYRRSLPKTKTMRDNAAEFEAIYAELVAARAKRDPS